ADVSGTPQGQFLEGGAFDTQGNLWFVAIGSGWVSYLTPDGKLVPGFNCNPPPELGQTCEPQDFLPFVTPRLSISLPHLHDRLTTDPAHIIAETITEHGHQDAQQTVPKSAQSLAMPMSFGSQSRIHLAEVRLTLHGDARHVIQRMTSPRITPAPHHDLTAFATLSRHRCHPAMRAHHLRVPFGQSLGSFGKQPGRDLATNRGEGLHSRH